MKIGTNVRIRNCESILEVVGENGEIVDMQIQPFEKYTTYPLWIKISSGKHRGKVYGFKYDEVEKLPQMKESQINDNKQVGETATMNMKLINQVEKLLKDVTTVKKKGTEKAIRIGAQIQVISCNPMPEVVGQKGEIVDMQIQPYDKYSVYPLWVRITSGERQGKIYGFKYDEVKVIPQVSGTEMTREKVVSQLEEFIKVTRIGAKAIIRKCDSLPEVVGENGEIVDMQVQPFEKYTVYPLWVKITSGKRQGKIYGFKYDEVEVLPKVRKGRVENTKLSDQLEEILRGITTIDEIAEIERLIGEAKSHISTEKTAGFWEDKTPCWEMLSCPKAIMEECPAFKNQGLPCWQIEGTYSKLHGDGEKGHNTDICQVCRVYKRWGHDEPIEIKLFGKGFNAPAKEATK